MRLVGRKQVAYHLLRLQRGVRNLGMPVQVVEKELLELNRLQSHGRAEIHQRWQTANGVHIVRPGSLQGCPGGVNHVIDLGTEHAPDGLIKQAPPQKMGVLRQCLPAEPVEKLYRLQLLQGDQPGAHAVVDVVGVVGNFVREIAKLGFQSGLGPLQKPPADPTGFDSFQPARVDHRAMLENALARLEAKVQAVKLRVALFERIDHPQALQVVLKTTVLRHAGVERVLASMTERRMPQIMRQCDGLHQVFIEPQRPRDGAAQLRHLQ
jgi:hypothetical protein